MIADTVGKGCAYGLASVSVEPSLVIEGLWQAVNKVVDPGGGGAADSWEGLWAQVAASRQGGGAGETLLGWLYAVWKWLLELLGLGGAGGGQSEELSERGGAGRAKGDALVEAGSRPLLDVVDDASLGSEAGGCASGSEGSWCRQRARLEDLAAQAAMYSRYEGFEQQGPLLASLMTQIHLNAGPPTMLWKRAHFYNNFEISHLALWRSAPYRRLFAALDASGGIFNQVLVTLSPRHVRQQCMQPSKSALCNPALCNPGLAAAVRPARFGLPPALSAGIYRLDA